MQKLPKNIKHTQHYPTHCFLCIHGFVGLHNQQSRETIHIVSLHQENFLVLTKFVDESATFFKVSTFTNNTFLSSTMSLSQSDIEHEYVFSLNDKLGSSPRTLYSNCHNLSLQLVVPTQNLNIIFVTTLLPFLHEWFPCIQLF